MHCWQNLKKKSNLRNFQVFYFGCKAKSKTWKTLKFLFSFFDSVFLIFKFLVANTVSFLSESKISEISDLLILGIAKIKNIEILEVFRFLVFWKSSVAATVKIWSKRQICQVSDFSDFWLGILQNRKLENIVKILFFFLKRYLNLSFISFVVAFKSSDAITVNFEVIVTNLK